MLFGVRDKQMSSHPDREWTTYQSNNIAKVQPHEPMSLLGLITGIWVRFLLEHRQLTVVTSLEKKVSPTPKQPLMPETLRGVCPHKTLLLHNE